MGADSARETAADPGARLDAARLALQRAQIVRNRRALEDRDVLALLRKAAGVSWWHVREWWRRQAPDTAGAGSAVPPVAPYLVRQRYPARPGRARVLHLIANFVTGGSSRLVVDLVEQLGHRFDQTVVTAMAPRPAHYEGVAIVECATLASVADAQAIVEANRPDLIHVHYLADADSPYGITDFHWYCRLFDALEQAGPDRPWRVVQNVNIPVPPYISPCVDRYVYVSDYVRDRFGLQTAPGLTVYPGSDLERFGPAGSSEVVPDDTIGMVYRLERDKLDDRAIEPFIRVIATRPRTTALIIGGGTYLAAYREAVRRAGLEASFTFTGEVAYDALPELIRRMAVFVAPVHTESFGQVSPFAMGLARPVAGYAVGALPEITGDRSVLAPPGDAAGLAAIVAGLLDDRERRLRLGAANRQRALERFSVEAMAHAYERLYDTLLVTGAKLP